MFWVLWFITNMVFTLGSLFLARTKRLSGKEVPVAVTVAYAWLMPLNTSFDTTKTLESYLWYLSIMTVVFIVSLFTILILKKSQKENV
ncbi:hypothetical protein JCM30760_26410 [Thiomicrorhabdus hydrogeniphila]